MRKHALELQGNDIKLDGYGGDSAMLSREPDDPEIQISFIGALPIRGNGTVHLLIEVGEQTLEVSRWNASRLVCEICSALSTRMISCGLRRVLAWDVGDTAMHFVAKRKGNGDDATSKDARTRGPYNR